MMRALILLHRWLGVAFCLLFAMWFATGIVMHFVPFPSLTEAERIEGLAVVDTSKVTSSPAAAVAGSQLGDAVRVRLIARPDGPVYIVSSGSALVALHAAGLGRATVSSERSAVEIAVDHAGRRGLATANAKLAELANYDQWTVPNRFDPHRPLFRVALNDVADTDLYVSSVTGEVLLQTTQRERLWNYAGSVVHWIYPTILRSNWAAWDKTVWWLSLAAVIAALSGALLGTIRIRKAWRRIMVSLRGWHAWHHVLGLLTMTFVLTWIVSGWLSMDHGRLFSRGSLTHSEALAAVTAPAWSTIGADWTQHVAPGAREIEWFALDQDMYQRERTGLATQVLRHPAAAVAQPYLGAEEIGRWVQRFGGSCGMPFVLHPGDNYSATSAMPTAPVYRTACGDVWFHIDGANGAILERLDASRRAYRWFYTALHTWDLPVLMAHPSLRSTLIVGLCTLGFLFSITGMVLGWRRLRL